MKLLVLILAVGLAAADIGLTYNNYKVPETSYGVPSYQLNNNANSGYNYNSDSSVQGANGYQSGFQSGTSLGANNGNYASNFQGSDLTNFYNHGDLNSINTITPGYQYTQGSQNGYQYQSSSQHQASAVQKYQQFYNKWQNQPVQVFKHFYVHEAPEEPEEPKIRQPVVLPPPQKHYKIIFIKAPSQTVYRPQYIPVPQANEEKTIVYVLVKNPEEQQQPVVPKLEQKVPSKPEVFFVKYNNKADSQAVINNIVSDYGKGDSVNHISGGGSSGHYNQGQYNQGTTTGQYTQGSTTGQYNQGTGTGQYHQGSATGQYNQGASTGQYTQGSTTGQYNQGIGTGQYNQESSATGQYNQGASTGQYTQGSTTGQYNQEAGSGQYTQGSTTGQYNQGTGTGQYHQGSATGQYNQGASTGQYNQGTAGQFAQGSYNQYGGQGSSTAGYVSSAAASASATTSDYTSDATSNVNLGNLNTISTSQGVPHETYGPPKFRA